MGLKDIQTQIITQAPSPVTGQLVGYIAASFRVYDISNPSAPVEDGSIPLTVTIVGLDAVHLLDPTIVFVTDGSLSTNLLYAVDVSNMMAPVVAGQLEIS